MPTRSPLQWHCPGSKSTAPSTQEHWSASCVHWASPMHSIPHADFSGICEGALAISGIMQGTHIEVNEHGARAAVYTGIAVAGAAPQWGPEITFTVDRPFMYALMTRDRLPLFVGAVRNL
ncbi:serpin family protein [Bifidobacterium pseudolongum]|uniref:serpin family protein n=1 Tax=Bifidobacterium pseudolongum TaxID=1694 RepID=UPI001020D7AE